MHTAIVTAHKAPNSTYHKVKHTAAIFQVNKRNIRKQHITNIQQDIKEIHNMEIHYTSYPKDMKATCIVQNYNTYCLLSFKGMTYHLLL